MSFYFRTESINKEKILELSILSKNDRNIVNVLKGNEPTLLEGSRGTGKSFLMRVAEAEIEKDSSSHLPVYVTFNISSLINTKDPLQFYHWMLAKILSALISKLRKKGISLNKTISCLLSKDQFEDIKQTDLNLKDIVHLYENSFDIDNEVDTKSLPDVEDVKDAIEDLCEEFSIGKISFFFDEATHVFRPEQQRQFFNLFKDLRSSHIICNAAIYPGVTYFGTSFEITHDCTFLRIDRSIRDDDYLESMSSIVLKQMDDSFKSNISKQMNLFHMMIYACSGNPRLLMRTLEGLTKLTTNEVEKIIKDFYRTQIWTEHTSIGEKYSGHKEYVDWGRKFVEDIVIQAIIQRNRERTNEQILYFWIDKDSPKTIQEALRLLTYTGIIKKIDSGVKSSESKLGTRYEVKFGCILAHESSPSSTYKHIIDHLTIKRFISYFKNTLAFNELNNDKLNLEDNEVFINSVIHILNSSIDVLSITDWQKNKIKEQNILTLKDLYDTSEELLIEKIYGVGNTRARQIKNALISELLEYLSG